MPTKRIGHAVETDTALPITAVGGARGGGAAPSVTVAVPAGVATASGIPPKVVTGQVKVSGGGRVRVSGYATHPPRELTATEHTITALLAQLVPLVAITDYDVSGLEAAILGLLTYLALVRGARRLPPSR